MAKVAIGGVVVALLLFLIVTQPDATATMAQGAWNLVEKIANGIGDFVHRLAS